MRCKKSECTRNAWAKGLCKKHYTDNNQLESKLQRDCGKLAEAAGYLPFKFESPGNPNVPDCVFVGHGRVFFVEFKRRGKKPRPLQLVMIEVMRNSGAEVHVIDNKKEFKALL